MYKIIINGWERFWKLTAIQEVMKKRGNRYVSCKCDCWIITEVQLWCLRNWWTKSCGCYNKESHVTHWMHATSIYKAWTNIKDRCTNINNPSYKDYWERWITYDEKWETFEWFHEDMKEWYAEHLTIDREDNNWNYSKSNCRWITMKKQCRNRRNIHNRGN